MKYKIIKTSPEIFQVQRPNGTFWKVTFKSYEDANEGLYQMLKGFNRINSQINIHINRKLREAKRIAGLD